MFDLFRIIADVMAIVTFQDRPQPPSGRDGLPLDYATDKLYPMSQDARSRPQPSNPERVQEFSGPLAQDTGRVLGTTLVRAYQLTLSSLVGQHCRHMPTCSEYAYEAIARHGLWPGGWMGLFRVMRCGPWGTHGIDRVPVELPSRFKWWMPWQYWRVRGDV